jgi:hypothetical protein
MENLFIELVPSTPALLRVRVCDPFFVMPHGANLGCEYRLVWIESAIGESIVLFFNRHERRAPSACWALSAIYWQLANDSSFSTGMSWYELLPLELCSGLPAFSPVRFDAGHLPARERLVTLEQIAHLHSLEVEALHSLVGRALEAFEVGGFYRTLTPLPTIGQQTPTRIHERPLNRSVDAIPRQYEPWLRAEWPRTRPRPIHETSPAPFDVAEYIQGLRKERP